MQKPQQPRMPHGGRPLREEHLDGLMMIGVIRATDGGKAIVESTAIDWFSEPVRVAVVGESSMWSQSLVGVLALQRLC